MQRRTFLAAGLATAAASATLAAAEPPPRVPLGLLIYSFGLRAKAEKARGFGDPIRFAAFAAEQGAAAVQLPLGIRGAEEAAAIRRECERLGVACEGIVSPPQESAADRERFAAELRTAKECGAEVVRTVLLGGRRYEVFTKPEDYAQFAARAAETLQRAAPAAERAKVALAVENHKDFRTDEQIDLLKKIASEWLGVCLDTGNNLALLEDPLATARALAPFARTVHLKDIGVEEAADGFRMSEVPLGQGSLDLAAIVGAIHQASPRARFHLEMITRDPLSIPCLGETYWATLGKVPGSDLARTLAQVRRSARPAPLPRITGLAPDEQLAAEQRHVRESFGFAAEKKLLPAK